MIRLIKRYESRKLYDTEESRYVSLEDISLWVREGQEVRVVDNATSSDVTAQTLTQIILDEGRKRGTFLPSELLHDLVRAGERAVTSRVEQVKTGVSDLVERSIDRLGPVRRAREEMGVLRNRLEELESSLTNLEASNTAANGSESPETAAERKASRAKKSAAKASPPKAAKAKNPAPKKRAKSTAGAKKTAG